MHHQVAHRAMLDTIGGMSNTGIPVCGHTHVPEQSNF